MWSKYFCINIIWIQSWLTLFNICALPLKFGIFVPNFKTSFIIFLSIVSHCFSKCCSLTYNITIRAPIVSIRSPSDGTGRRAPYPSVFIQCVNGRDPMANELWSHRLDRIFHGVQPTAWLYIPPGTDVEFIKGYLNTYGRCLRIIGQSFINGSVQLIGFPEAWVISLPYISNATNADTNIGWVCTGEARNSNSSTSTSSWGRTSNVSPGNSLRIPACSRVVQSRKHN